MGFRTYILTLQPDQEYSMSVPESNFVGCTAGEIDFVIRPDDKEPLTMRKGISIAPDEKFNSVRITNGSSAQTIELFIGAGDMRDARLIAEGGTTIKANRLATISKVTVGAAAVLVDAANVNRSSVLLVNMGTAQIYWGLDNTVTALTGMPLVAGASISITAQSAIWAIRDTINVELRVFEESN